MTSEIKFILGGVAIIAGAWAFVECNKTIQQRRISEIELEKIKEEANYPASYWEAKKAEAEADAKKHELDVQSNERLELDKRDRADEEAKRLREFEKDAPKEYWHQKEIDAAEETKREKYRLDCESKERIAAKEFNAKEEIARYNRDAIKEGAKAAERAISRKFGYNCYGLA